MPPDGLRPPVAVTHGIFLRASTWAWLGVVLAALLVVYWPGLGGGFVFDDFPNIVDNPTLHVTAHSTLTQWWAAVFSSPSVELQRPLAMLTFALNHAVTGLDPYWMKLTNLVIHAVNTALVFGLVRCLLRAADRRAARPDDATRRDRQALWISAAWALNPINLMAVLFVVQRMESLCHTFVFGGLWLYLLGRERLDRGGNGWPMMLAGLIGGTIVGVLVKESAALLPLYALAMEWIVLGFSSRKERKDRRLLVMFLLVLVLPAALAAAWQFPKALHAGGYSNRSFTLVERLLTESRVVLDYLHWTVLPNLNSLSLHHDDYAVSHGLLSPPSTLVALLLLAILLTSIPWLRNRRPLMALGLAWFFAAQLLTATIFPLELVYEHRNYFASLGVCLVLGDGLLRLPGTARRQAMGAMLAIGLLALFTGLTALRAREWREPLRFSISEEAKHPQSPRATYELARNYIILSGYKPDSPFTARAYVALDHAMHAPGASTLPEAAAIIMAARTHALIQPVWWQSLRQKLTAQPIGPQQTSSLASLVDCDLKHQCQLPQQEMIDTFLAALGRGPNAEVLNIYGNYALNLLDDPALALRLWQDAAHLAPDVVQYQVTLAKMLIASGQPAQAAPVIARIRQMGQLGQNEQIAGELEQLAANASGARPSTPQPVQ